MATTDSAEPPANSSVESEEYQQLLTQRAMAVFDQLKAAEPGQQLLLFPRRPAPAPDMMSRVGPAGNQMVDLAGRVGITVLVSRMAHELGHEHLAAMSEGDFQRTLAEWMAERLEIPDRAGFLAALQRALGLASADARPTQELPLAYAQGHAEIPSSITLRAVSHLAWAEPDQLRRDEQGHLSYEHTEPQGEVVLTIREHGPFHTASATGIARSDWLEREFRNFNDADLDTLLVVLARLSQSPGTAGVWLASADVLNERGAKKKRKRENGKYYDCGHRPEDLAEVASSMERLGMIWVDIQRAEVPVASTRGRRRTTTLTLEDRLVHLGPRVGQDQDSGERTAIAWYVRPGHAISSPVAHEMQDIARHVLNYHSHHLRWAKRLGIYFAINMRLGGTGSVVRRRVGDLLHAVSLNFEDRNPHRSWRKLNDALLRLHTDGVITFYEFCGLPEPLPARNWADVVLNSWLEVHGPHPQLAAGDRVQRLALMRRADRPAPRPS